MKIEIPQYVKKLLHKLTLCGYEAYGVGGCVRDVLLGKEPFDWDVCTSAYPDEMKEVFSEYRVIETGIKHGTLTVLSDRKPVEITTFRTDGEYVDFRRPAKVEFTRSLKEDLKRRDFTVNALCCDTNGEIYDYTGGIADLQNRTLRTVGNADERFNEDALRILRLARFCSVLDFQAEKETYNSALSNAHLLTHISKERINIEFSKLLSGVSCERVLTEFEEVIKTVFPEIYEKKDAFPLLSKTTELDTKLALLFYGDSNTAKSALERLKFSNSHISNTSLIATDYSMPKTLPEMLYMLKSFGKDITEKKIQVFEILSKDVSLCKELFSKAQNMCYSLKTLSVNGEDLKNAGITDGKKIGETLNFLLDSVINMRVENQRDALLKYISK